MTMLKSGAKLSCFLSLWLAVCVYAVDAKAQIPPLFSFSDDFSAAAVKPQWSSTTTSLAVNVAPSGQRFLGRAGGNDGLSNDTVKLTLTGVPATGVVFVEFNLFIIRSMDGNEPFVFNSNGFTAALTFSNLKIAFHAEMPTQVIPGQVALPSRGRRVPRHSTTMSSIRRIFPIPPITWVSRCRTPHRPTRSPFSSQCLDCRTLRMSPGASTLCQS